MIALLNAIYSRFTSDAALVAAFPGGLHRDQAPEETPMPYLVSKVLESKIEYSYGGPCRTDVRIRFSAYGVGHDASGLLMQTFIAHTDDQLLTLSAGAHDTLTRLGDALPVLHKHDSHGNDVWEWSVTYEYGIRR